MKTRITLLAIAALVAVTAPVASAAARDATSTLCVAAHAPCYLTVQAAVDAANPGDTIAIERGSFAGGVTITKSLSLVGQGPGASIVKGGAPVLTIGTLGGENGFAVSLEGLTITGGLNSSQPQNEIAFGGGIWIPVGANQATGATVSIADSAVTNNTVTTTAALPAFNGFCGPLPCGFADGGGIDNGGTLSVTNTTISGNAAGPGLASGSFSGGIENRFQASLLLSHSIVSGNRALSAGPNGLGANAGGIRSDGQMTIHASLISGNDVEVQQTHSGNFDNGAFAGGIEISDADGAAATITNSIVTGNRVSSASSVDDIASFAGGILDEGLLSMGSTSVDHNVVHAKAPGSAFTDGGGLEVDGTATITNSVIAANTDTAVAVSGQALAQGGGLANVGRTTLQRTLVTGNVASASGPPGGLAQGGGVWNGAFDPSMPLPMLTLIDSAVTGNHVTAGGGITAQGGGVFTITPIVSTRTLIVGNAPDQCEGC